MLVDIVIKSQSHYAFYRKFIQGIQHHEGLQCTHSIPTKPHGVSMLLALLTLMDDSGKSLQSIFYYCYLSYFIYQYVYYAISLLLYNMRCN